MADQTYTLDALAAGEPVAPSGADLVLARQGDGRDHAVTVDQLLSRLVGLYQGGSPDLSKVQGGGSIVLRSELRDLGSTPLPITPVLNASTRAIDIDLGASAYTYSGTSPLVAYAQPSTSKNFAKLKWRGGRYTYNGAGASSMFEFTDTNSGTFENIDIYDSTNTGSGGALTYGMRFRNYSAWCERNHVTGLRVVGPNRAAVCFEGAQAVVPPTTTASDFTVAAVGTTQSVGITSGSFPIGKTVNISDGTTTMLDFVVADVDSVQTITVKGGAWSIGQTVSIDNQDTNSQSAITGTVQAVSGSAPAIRIDVLTTSIDAGSVGDIIARGAAFTRPGATHVIAGVVTAQVGTTLTVQTTSISSGAAGQTMAAGANVSYSGSSSHARTVIRDLWFNDCMYGVEVNLGGMYDATIDGVRANSQGAGKTAGRIRALVLWYGAAGGSIVRNLNFERGRSDSIYVQLAPGSTTATVLASGSISAFNTAAEPAGDINWYVRLPGCDIGGADLVSQILAVPATNQITLADAPALVPAYSAAVVNGGTGFAVNDILQFDSPSLLAPAKIQVTSVSGGAITGFTWLNKGAYGALPSNPAAATVNSGTGSGATFNLTYGVKISVGSVGFAMAQGATSVPLLENIDCRGGIADVYLGRQNGIGQLSRTNKVTQTLYKTLASASNLSGADTERLSVGGNPNSAGGYSEQVLGWKSGYASVLYQTGVWSYLADGSIAQIASTTYRTGNSTYNSGQLTVSAACRGVQYPILDVALDTGDAVFTTTLSAPLLGTIRLKSSKVTIDAANSPLGVLYVDASGNLKVAATSFRINDGTKFVGILLGSTSGTPNEPKSPLHVNGAIASAIKKISVPGTYVLDETYSNILVDASTGSITLQLPNAASCDGRGHNVKRLDASANTVTLTRSNTTDTIRGGTSYAIGAGGSAAEWLRFVAMKTGTSTGDWY